MLPWQYRLYFWSVHGLTLEVTFTCLYDQVFVKPNPTLIGYSSIWSLLIFGLFPFLIGEPLYNFMRKSSVSLPLRVIVYVLLVYCWEFCWGMLLVPFGANSWSYEEHRFNFMGVITLEYAPFWALGALIFEYIMHIMINLEEIPYWRNKAN